MTKKPKRKKPREWVRYALVSPRKELFSNLYLYAHPWVQLAPGWKQIKVRIMEIVE